MQLLPAVLAGKKQDFWACQINSAKFNTKSTNFLHLLKDILYNWP
jgi:hypothetical protein